MGTVPELDDLLEEGLRVVICGTAASRESAIRRQYYAGPGNRFWDVLAETGLTPIRLSPAEYRRLIEFGIGLTDVVKDQSGMDHELVVREGQGREVLDRIRVHAPAVLCFNGKRAAQETLGVRKVPYGPIPEPVGGTRLFVAPSTSAAARRWWDADIWRELADLVPPLPR